MWVDIEGKWGRDFVSWCDKAYAVFGDLKVRRDAGDISVIAGGEGGDGRCRRDSRQVKAGVNESAGDWEVLCRLSARLSASSC